MKTRFSLLAIGLGLLPLTALAVPENPVFHTSRGAVFSEEDDQIFGQGWRAPDGLIWSTCQGSFSNHGKFIAPLDDSVDGRIIDSAAAQACNKIGGRVPSIEEYQSLYAVFGLGKSAVSATQKDLSDFLHLFPDCRHSNGEGPGNFWTSSAIDEKLVRAIWRWDAYGDVTRSDNVYFVRCVKP